MRACMRFIIVRAASRELIPDARIANNRMRRAGCGLSRLVIPRVQQRDCSEEVSERASAATGRARIRRVNRVRNNNIYTKRVYVIDEFPSLRFFRCSLR